jgi:hypothetical protein
MTLPIIAENKFVKTLRSPDYNYNFSKVDGRFETWGKTVDDDPDLCPYGPVIADVEVSSAAYEDVQKAKLYDSDNVIVTEGGCNGVGCGKFCYKSSVNGISAKTAHMTLDAFKAIMDKMPRSITQIAFGICSIDSHPQLWDIFYESRRRGVIPNVTVNGVGITNDIAARLSSLCGAVAVSVNPQNKQYAYDAVKLLSQDFGMKQINFHIVLSEDSVPFVKQVVDDIKVDSRLAKLNALVMLSFKDKAKTNCMKSITMDSYKDVIQYCEEAGIAFGFDSCSAHSYMRAIKHKSNYDDLCKCVEPCESLLGSIYINVFGEIFACSFSEGVEEWKDGIPIANYGSIEEIWQSPRANAWRDKLMQNKRECPFYKIGKEDGK